MGEPRIVEAIKSALKNSTNIDLAEGIDNLANDVRHRRIRGIDNAYYEFFLNEVANRLRKGDDA